jgi:hypothetical protein
MFQNEAIKSLFRAVKALRHRACCMLLLPFVLIAAGCQPAIESRPTPTVQPESAATAEPAAALKPADSDTPAAGICGDAQYDPVSIPLGSGPDGLPLAGRCIVVKTTQRIQLINQTGSQVNFQFAGFNIDLPAGGEMLLDKPAGDYLALGVHLLPMGPEVWVRAGAQS